MKKISTFLSFFILLAGLALGLSLATLSAWADLEANFYGFTRQSKTPFQGLSCPAIMTAEEVKPIYIKVTNRVSQPIAPNVRVEFSAPLLPEAALDFLELQPGESATIAKTVDKDNIDLGSFIFVKALVYSSYPMPDEEGTCGIYVLPLRGSGTIILVAWTAASLLLTGGGIFFLQRRKLPTRKINPFLFLAFLLLPAFAFSFSSWWIQAIFVIVLSLLTLVIGLGNLVESPNLI